MPLVWLFLLLAAVLTAVSARGAGADDAVAALAQLTDPARIAALSDAAFTAQLGPALGWLHVARRRAISPEAVIARAFQANGLDSARAQLTRDCLLRNLARADAWQLFGFPGSAQAMALGQPAVIQSGVHRGHLAKAEVLPGELPRQFADLVLRSDAEPPLRQDRRISPRANEHPAAPRRRARAARLDPIPTAYDDALPER